MMIKEIVSPNNPIFLKLLKLQKGQEIKKTGLTFLSGLKQVQEVLRDYPEQCAAIVFNRDHEHDEFSLSGIQAYRFSSPLFRKIDIYGTGQPILIIKVGPLPSWSNQNWSKGCTLFIPFQDPINIGSMIRSAAAFGVSQLVLLQEAAHPFHHKAIRVAGSTVFRIPLFRGPSIKELPGFACPVYTLSPDGQDVALFKFPPFFGLIAGLEGPGIPSALQNLQALAIPMQNQVESLNAATAAGIVLYLWRRQMPDE